MSAEQKHTPWEFVEAEYLSHDAPGYSQTLSAGGIMSADEDGEPYWVIEGEIEPKIGKRIVRAVNSHDDLLAALLLAEDVLSRAPASTRIWPNGMHPNDGVERIRAAIAKATGAQS